MKIPLEASTSWKSFPFNMKILKSHWKSSTDSQFGNPVITKIHDYLPLVYTTIYLKQIFNSLFNTTTKHIVIQKNDPGQSAESAIASATVTIKTSTSTKILKTIRGVKLPLKVKNFIKLRPYVCANQSFYPKFTNILIQLKKTFGIWAASPIYCKKFWL